MIADNRWIFVDDSDDAETFADQLSEGVGAVKVSVKKPADAREILESNAAANLGGVLMDVDFSQIEGERGTGPGMAQDLRVKQRAGEVREFPVVRFAAKGPIMKNVAGDPASDDLFDLKIGKEELALDLARGTIYLSEQPECAKTATLAKLPEMKRASLI